MAVDYELSTMQSRKQFFSEDENTNGRITLPGEREFTVRVNKFALVGIFACFFLTFVGLVLNIYFVASLTTNKECVQTKPGTNQVQGSSFLTSEDSVRYRSNSTDKVDASQKADVEYCITVFRNHLINTAGTRNDVQEQRQDIDTFLRKVDQIGEKVDDLKGNFDIFEKKLDGMITRIDEKSEIISDLKANCDETNQTLNSISNITNQMTSFASTIETVRNEHEQTARKVEQIRADVSSLNTFALGTLAESLLRLNVSITSNLDSSNTLLEASKKHFSDEQSRSGQVTESIINNTGKLDSLSREIYNLSEKLRLFDNKTNSAMTEMKVFLQGRVNDMMNEILTAVLNNGNLTQIYADATNLFFVRTDETLQGLGGSIQELDTTILLEIAKNISDQLKVSAADIKDIESLTREVGENSNEVSVLQRSILEKSESMNRSIGSIQTQSLMTSDMIISFIQNSDNFSRGLSETVSHTRANMTEELRLFEQKIVETISTTSDQISTDFTNLRSELINGSHLMSNQDDDGSIVSDELVNSVNASFVAIREVKDLVQGLSGSMTSNSSTQVPRLVNEISTMKSLVESLISSVTIDSNKLENSNLSSAVIKLLDESSTIHQAIMSSANQTLSCRSDGCFFKTIPVGLPPTSDFVQKDEVRLANAQIGSGGIRGRLEVYRSGSWGTVCDDSFSNTDATVVCRMLGYTTGIQKQSAFFGAGTGTIHMDDVRCSGRETSIFSCSFTSRHNCGHGEDVGVICN